MTPLTDKLRALLAELAKPFAQERYVHKQLADLIAASLAEIEQGERARAVLEPFQIAETEFSDLPDDHPISVHTTAYPVREIMLSLRDFRRARTALGGHDAK